MRASSLYLALGIAPLARCAPMYRGSVDHVDDGPDARRGGAPAPTAWSPYIHWGVESGPERHEPSTAPWAEESRPLDDELPRPLSKHRASHTRLSGTGQRTQGDTEIHEIRISRPVHNEADIIIGRPHYGRPHRQDQSSRERNDMLVVFLAIAFMAAVVLMETWGRIFRRQGAIRLEDTPKQPPIVIRIIPADEDCTRDEKRCM